METENALVQNESFLRSAYGKALIPCMLSILGGSLNILADGIIVGRQIGTGGLAAISICLPVYLVLCVAGSLIVSGTAISASQETGAGNRETAQYFYSCALFLSFAASLLFTVFGVPLSMPLSRLLCGKEMSLVPDVFAYNVVTLAGSSVKILLYLPYWFLRLDGKHKSVTMMTALMGIGNIVLDIVFLYGLHMGMAGAALASVIATGAACLFGFLRLHRGETGFRFRVMVPDKKSLLRIARKGSVAAGNNALQAARLLFVNRLLLSYGGDAAVALFTAVNGVLAYTEAVTAGVPTAASAMLGVYSGEKDNASIRLLIRREVKSGVIYSLLCGVLVVLFHAQIASLYGLTVSMRVVLLYAALSLVPSLLNQILSGFYNMSDRVVLSNLIVVLRVLVFAAGSLSVLVRFGAEPWPFLFLGEMLTLVFWYAATAMMHRKKPMLSRYLLLDERLDREGRVISFSATAEPETICNVSERITSFCEDNGMSPKMTMRVSLALEEIMTVIAGINAPKPVLFDVRVLYHNGQTRIRIRDNGRLMDVSDNHSLDDDLRMGLDMIGKLASSVIYRSVFGMNTLVITYGEPG